MPATARTLLITAFSRMLHDLLLAVDPGVPRGLMCPQYAIQNRWTSPCFDKRQCVRSIGDLVEVVQWRHHERIVSARMTC